MGILRDSWRALEREHLSLWELLSGDPEGYGEEGSGDRHHPMGVHSPGIRREVVSGLWKRGISLSLYGSSVRGTWREGSLAGDPDRYVEKALETGISFHRDPVWGTWRAHLPGL